MRQEICIDTSSQTLTVFDGEKKARQYVVATAKNGVGERFGSERTPLGWHVIRAKIGSGEKLNSVFSARRCTGEIYTEQLAKAYPQRDWVLTRILWLSGCEVGINRLGNVDTMRRFIYIHGTPDIQHLGRPSSHGCIRMSSEDIADLYDLVPLYTRVLIF